MASKIPGTNVNLSTFLGQRLVNSIFLDAITENEVEFEIRQLNGNKSCGHDEIPPKLVKKIAKHIIRPLTYIYITSHFLLVKFLMTLKLQSLLQCLKQTTRKNFPTIGRFQFSHVSVRPSPFFFSFLVECVF